MHTAAQAETLQGTKQVLLKEGHQLLHDLVVDAAPPGEQEIMHLLLRTQRHNIACCERRTA